MLDVNLRVIQVCLAFNDLEFDPKPLLSAFEEVTAELLKVKRKVKKKIEDQEDAFNASELSRRAKFEDIRKMFDVFIKSDYHRD